MTQTIYRTWCPDLGQPEAACIVVLAIDVAHAAEQWAAWADAYLGDGAGPGVSSGAVHRVCIDIGRGSVVEMAVTGYTAAVYAACTPSVMDRMIASDETPRTRRSRATRRHGDMPPLPRPPRLQGVATTVDGVAAIYTDEDLRALRVAAYRLGEIDRPPLEQLLEERDNPEPPEAREARLYEHRTGRKAHD